MERSGFSVRRVIISIFLLLITARAAQSGELIAWGSNSAHQTEVPSGKNYIAVAAGKYHNLALKDTGKLVSWGDDTYKQVTNTPTTSDFVGVACGEFHSVAWKADGTIMAWGRNHFQQIDVPTCEDCNAIVDVVCGANHNLVLRDDKSLKGWGNNDEGQIIIPSDTTFLAAAAGGKHNIGIKTDGNLAGWGWNAFLQATIPAGLDKQVIQVACGEYHSLALKKDGSVVAWGLNSHGQGVVPEPIASNTYLAISAGSLHNIALRDDYGVDVWGNDITTDGEETPDDTDFIQVAAGGYHCVGILDPRMKLLYPNGGESFRGNERINIEWEAWDDYVIRIEYSTDNGQTWTEITDSGGNDTFEWIIPQTLSEECLIRISAADNPEVFDLCDSPFRIFGSGIPIGWGSNAYKQIDVPELDDIVAISSGFKHNLALRADGSLISWGTFDDEDSDSTHVIDDTPEGNDFIAIAAGGFHSLALHQNGSIAAWGKNTQKQTDLPNPNENFKAIAAGDYFSLALRQDGTLIAWGSNSNEQVTKKPVDGPYKAIGAGYKFAMAIHADTGKITAWGKNDENQTSGIDTIQQEHPDYKFIQVDGGKQYGIGLLETGEIIQWGTAAPSNKPTDPNYIQISANELHAAALARDGRIVCWGGNNLHGELNAPDDTHFLAVSAGADYTLALAEPGIELIDPNGSEKIVAGGIFPITWQTHIPRLYLEFSSDTGGTWQKIDPNAVSNTGSYDWRVPDIETESCLVRVSSYTSPDIFYAVCPQPFIIYRCLLQYDLNYDCKIDLSDLACLLTEWLDCGNPYDKNCQPETSEE